MRNISKLLTAILTLSFSISATAQMNEVESNRETKANKTEKVLSEEAKSKKEERLLKRRGFWNDWTIQLNGNHLFLTADAISLRSYFGEDRKIFDEFRADGLINSADDEFVFGYGVRVSKQMNRFWDLGIEYSRGNYSGTKNIWGSNAFNIWQVSETSVYDHISVNSRINLNSFGSKINKRFLVYVEGAVAYGFYKVNLNQIAHQDLGGSTANVLLYDDFPEQKTESLLFGFGGGIDVRVSERISLNLGTKYFFGNDDIDYLSRENGPDFINPIGLENNVFNENNDGYWLSNLGIAYNMGRKVSDKSERLKFESLKYSTYTSQDMLEMEKARNKELLKNILDEEEEKGVSAGSKGKDTVIIRETIIEKLVRDTVVIDNSSTTINTVTKTNYAMAKFKPVYFDLDKHNIRPDQRKAIIEAADFLSSNPNANLLLVGHADQRGNEDYNLELSRKRCEAVKMELINKYGIAPLRLSIDYKGESALDYSTNDLNRRVDIMGR